MWLHWAGFDWPPVRREQEGRAARAGREGFFLRTVGSRPAGRKLSIVVLLAACAAGGRWGPVRGCAPPRPPLHSPRTTPRGFPASIILRGLRVFCSGSFPPFGRVISLRAAQCHSPLSLCTKIQGHLHRPEQFYFEIAADSCTKATTKVQTIASPKQTGRQIPLKKQALLSLLLPCRRPIKQQLKAFHPEGRLPTTRRTSLPFLATQTVKNAEIENLPSRRATAFTSLQ